MLRPIDEYFLQQQEPAKSCLQYLREYILRLDPHITEAWKYRMPFYCYNEKMFCYLWVHKQYHQPYIGIVEGKRIHHPDLLTEKRARMKILLLDPDKDLPVKKIDTIFTAVLALYRK
ncbi:DUF1801 domain-containing protein [Chitinophaga agrisoli]|uniref:DUF1801 domain-containing protein n=1 Tax=Chitinophaga agrisoli TaxID=2607653 RepID=A0A5B2VRL1_9BACT|nr:DUF1801 domain-containing protein [Chitinophaga agrisoli]KAA2240882.1 DUF1801 domain-containing protein [Chitinophaga agrisoli]